MTQLELVWREKGLVAINKPPGLLVIPGRAEESAPCAKDLLVAQLKCPVWVCHRIDRDTSGIVLFATDANVHRTVSKAFEQGEVRKRYLALVQGRVPTPLDIDLALAEGRKRTMRVALPGEEGKASRTLVRPLEVFARASLVECEPLTGRQHQLRVHLRAKGHPLLFDHQYGRRQPLLESDLGGSTSEIILARTPLHAAALSIDALGVAIEAPLPADITAALTVLRAAAR